MTTEPTSASAIPGRLREIIRGRLWLPGEEGFDRASAPWNVAIAQHVLAVVEAADPADVAALVRSAAQVGVSISTQPSGHGATGNSTGTILLRTGCLDDIEVDPAAKRARIGAGVRAGHLQQAVAQHGLTAMPGSSPVVSVTAVALGGGLSWFSRAFGWVADSITGWEVVDAAGAQRTVTADSDPELFWALRGGGGDYGIVTGLDVALHEAPAVFGGRLLWEASAAHAVARAYRQMTAQAPKELTLWLELLQFPGAAPMVAIDSTFLGAEAQARTLMAEVDRLPPPLSDTRAMMSVADLGAITADPTDPVPGQSRAELLTRLDDAALDALLQEPIDPLTVVQVRHLGGALTQPSDSPHGALTEPYAAYLIGVPTEAAVAESIAMKQERLARTLPVSGRKPLTFLNPAESLSDALPAESIERLRRIKTDRDPAGTFRSNFSVQSLAPRQQLHSGVSQQGDPQPA